MLCHHECKEGSLILCHPEHKRRISILYVILSLSEGSHEILRAKALRMTLKERIIHEIFLRGINTKKL